MSHFDVRIALAAALWMIAVPGFAFEPWEGRWSESSDPQTCSVQQSGAPLVVISREVTPIDAGQGQTPKEAPKGNKGQITFEGEGDSSTCYIGKITGVRNLDAWILDIECLGDGETRRDRTIVMKTTVPEGIAAYNLGSDFLGGVTQLYRCTIENDGPSSVDPSDQDAANQPTPPPAEYGDAVAQYNLGAAFAIGQDVEQDYSIAKTWFERSAEQGYAVAQNRLGIMFAEGQGIKPDSDVALVWFTLAASQNEPEAVKNRASLIQRMSPDQVAAADRVAELYRDGKAFSTVEGEVSFERDVGVWRECLTKEARTEAETKPNPQAVAIALDKCDYLGEAMIGNLARIDPRLDPKVLNALLVDVRETLKEQLAGG